MDLTIYQSITINTIKVGAVMNSSVFQIGTSGSIQSRSDTYNTGGYTELAEPVPYVEGVSPVIPLSPTGQ
ncbi:MULTISPECIES: spore germination protein GerPB [unclassified Virgibacillus]|uniref:spore germination protein GerPB n=1 Tax=unclassified Virgibacillus TaxID=2620237 RepID=UPI0024DE7BB1|nr:spore germination protein GerPB [Virgibacillus sp. LDC-1]